MVSGIPAARKTGYRSGMETDNETLALALTRLMRRQRLTYAQIARPGRLSRNTVRLIAKGITTDPGEDTLTKIGVGLSVDPYTGEIDQEVMIMSLRRLGRASGHPDLGKQWARDAIPVLLAAIVGSVERAEAWVDLIAQYPELDVERLRQIIEQFARK